MNDCYRAHDQAVWERIFAQTPPQWYEAPPSDAMIRCRAFFARYECHRLLDLGCGFGRWAMFLADTVPGIIGLDYAVNGARRASTWAHRQGRGAKFLASSALALPFQGPCFDGILLALLLDNLSRKDAERVMQEANRVTLPGARGFFLFNPARTASPEDSSAEENPTRDCMRIDYEDQELPQCLPGWEVMRRGVSDEGFRLIEGRYR